MSGNVLAVIGGTVALIAIFLILTIQSSGKNAFSDVVNNVGGQYTSIISTLMGPKQQ